MTENTKTIAPENTTNTPNAEPTYCVEKDFDKYSETAAATQTVDLFKVGKNPVRLNSADCAGDRMAYRAAVLKKIGTLARSRHAFTWSVSKVLYNVLQHAYKKRAPWAVTEVLCAFQAKGFSMEELRRFCKYFEVAGFDMQYPKGRDSIPVCEGIRDLSQQAAMFEKMSGINAYDMRINGGDPEERRAKAAASGDAAKRIRDGLNRAATTAKKNSEKSEDAEDKKLFDRERALALATKEVLSFLDTCDDPHDVVMQFRAWFESNHAKELEAKKAKEQANMIKAGKAA